MKNVPITDISYITNGSAISADVLNGPSVGLMQNVSILALATETFSEEILTSSNVAATLVIDSNIDSADLKGNISPGFISAIKIQEVNSSNNTDTFYAISLSGRSEVSSVSSQIELYSKLENKAKYVIKSSQVSSYYSGYSNINKARLLKNNGDSLALRIPRQNNTASVGLNSVSQFTAINNSDIAYTGATQAAVSLCKLPILDRISLASTMTISEFKGYFNSATQNQYALYFNAEGVITVKTNNQAADTVAGRFYVTVIDHSDKSKVLTLKLRNDGSDIANTNQITDSTDIHWFNIDVDSQGAPWDYTNENGSSRTINIYFKVDSDSSYTQIYTSNSSAFVPTQQLSDSYVYIPIATKVSSGIKFIDNIAPEILITDSQLDSVTPTATSSNLFDLKYLRSINNSIVRLSSVIKTGETFGRILCPENISRYIKHCLSLGDTIYIKLINLRVDTIKKPSLVEGADINLLQAIRTRSDSDSNTSFPGLSVFKANLSTKPMLLNIPSDGGTAELLALDPSPSNLSAFSMSNAFTVYSSMSSELTSNGSVALLTYELTDNNVSNIQPTPAPGSGENQMSRNIDITSSYKLIVSADVLFSFAELS